MNRSNEWISVNLNNLSFADKKKYFRHVLVDKDVVRLQVSVDDVVFVQVLQGQDDLGQIELEEDQQV